MARAGKILLEAEFDPRVRWYWLLSGGVFLTLIIVGIPLLPIWFGVGWWATGKYLSRMRCALTERAVLFEKGVFVRVEKTVPLDRITDVGLTQGPIQRLFDIERLSVETAGQSATGGSLLNVTGIRNGRAFRDRVLERRDQVTELHREQAASESPTTTAMTSAPMTTDAAGTLREIRDTLVRIERRLASDDASPEENAGA